VATYTLDIRDRVGGSLLKAGVEWKSLSAKWVLNGTGSIEVELRHDADISTAKMGQAELQVLRNGSIVWAGPWLTSDVDPKSKRLRITGEGLYWWFQKRVVTSDLLYSGVATHQIAWNLLNHAQGQTFGSLGIVQGTHTQVSGSAKNRDRFYCAANVPKVREEVDALTAYTNGIDFNFNPATRAFDTWSPSRQASSGIALTGSNTDTLTWSEDIHDTDTFVTAVGANECGSILVTSSDGTLANLYGRLHDAIDADDDDDTQSEVTEAADAELAAVKNPRFDANVTFRELGTAAGTPAFASLIPGNTLTLQDNRGYSTFGPKTLRMIEVTMHLDNGLPNQAIFELGLSSTGT
jgi:hypothetical protein